MKMEYDHHVPGNNSRVVWKCQKCGRTKESTDRDIPQCDACTPTVGAPKKASNPLANNQALAKRRGR